MKSQLNPTSQYHAPPMVKYKGINVNLKNLPKASSSDKWYQDKEKRKILYVICGSLLCVLIIGAIFAIPIALSIVLATTTTTTQSTSKTPSTTTIATMVSTSTVNTAIITMAATTTTTSVCRNMTCTFSSKASPMTVTYGVEHLDIECTQSLSSMNIEVIVRRTVNASYANQYQTFWNLTTNQTYIETNSQIIFTGTLLNGQIIQDIGFPYFVEGQYHLPTVNQTTSLDTYSATLTSVCGHTVSESGTF